MGFFDYAAEVAMSLMCVVDARRIYELVGVVVHLIAALWADHFAFIVGHRALLFSKKFKVQGSMFDVCAFGAVQVSCSKFNDPSHLEL
jgi:hypothetical protein